MIHSAMARYKVIGKTPYGAPTTVSGTPGQTGHVIKVPRGEPVPNGYVPYSSSDSGGESYIMTSSSPGVEPVVFPAMEALPPAETTADVLKAVLRYSPTLAAQDQNISERIEPQRAQLALDLSQEFLPQQLALELALQQQYLPEFTQVAADQQTISRTQDIEDVAALAPELAAIQQASMDPALLAIQDELYKQITEGLMAGAQPTAEQQRQVEQAARTAEQARGIEGGAGSVNREALARGMSSQEIQKQRQDQAQSLLGQQQAVQVDPFLTILGRPSTAATAGTQQFNSGLGQPTSAGTPQSGQSTALNTAQIGAQNYSTSVQQSLGQQQLALQQQQYLTGLQYAQNAALQYGVYL